MTYTREYERQILIKQLKHYLRLLEKRKSYFGYDTDQVHKDEVNNQIQETKTSIEWLKNARFVKMERKGK